MSQIIALSNKIKKQPVKHIQNMLTIKTPEWRHQRCFGVFIVGFDYVTYIFLVFLVSVSFSDFEWVNVQLKQVHYEYPFTNAGDIVNLNDFIENLHHRCLKGFLIWLYLLLTFTCSKLTIETLEQGVKYVQS